MSFFTRFNERHLISFEKVNVSRVSNINHFYIRPSMENTNTPKGRSLQIHGISMNSFTYKYIPRVKNPIC